MGTRLPSVEIDDLPVGIQLRYVLGPFPEKVSRLAWAPDGSMLAVPCRDNLLRLYDGDSGELLTTCEGHAQALLMVTWSPEGTTLASGGWDNVARVWDRETGEQIVVLEGHSREVNAVAWRPDGKTLATASRDGTVRLWGTDSWTLDALLQLPGITDILHLAWSPSGEFLAVSSYDGGVTVWDVDKREPCRSLQNQTLPSVMVAWSPDGRLLAAAAKGQDWAVRGAARVLPVHLWDTENETLLTTLTEHAGDVLAVAFSPDARFLATKSRDNTVRLRDCDSWQTVGLLQEAASFPGFCVGLAFHPTRPGLTSLGEEDTQVRVWDLDPDALQANAADPVWL